MVVCDENVPERSQGNAGEYQLPSDSVATVDDVGRSPLGNDLRWG
jgi:hypothetical protein